MISFKSYLYEAREKTKGIDYETVIVTAWNCKHEGKNNCKGTSAVPISVGQAIIKSLEQYGFKGGTASRIGNDVTQVTPEWSKYFKDGKIPSATKTPKTDVIIGNQRCSVKLGVGQLMSGGKAESTATFYAAAKKKGGKESLAAQIEKEIKQLADSTLASKKGEIGPQIKAGKDRAIARAEAAHKQLMETLRDAFANDTGFAAAFVHEAMSGDIKFGSTSPARAKYILSTNTTGTQVKLYDIDNSAYCASVAKKARVQVRFKTTSEKKGEKKTGYYRYWSVVSLIMGKMEEEFDAAGPMLTEGVISGIWNKITSFVSEIWNSISGWLQAKWENLIEFFGIDVDVNFDNEIEF
jgi:hypothetical protein